MDVLRYQVTRLLNKKYNMFIKLIFSSAFAILLCFTSQSKADWLMDFGPTGLSFKMDQNDFSFDPGSNFTGTLVTDHTAGHSWTLTGRDLDPDRTADIRYEFPSLLNNLDPNSIGNPNAPVSFWVNLDSDSNEGTFSLVGTAERASGGSYTFTNDSGGTPDDPNGNFGWVTDLTLSDLAADDITALNFEITFDYADGGTPGLDQTFTFGGPGGLIAAPEPTSAAMIGCALIGLIARRRRKA